MDFFVEPEDFYGPPSSREIIIDSILKEKPLKRDVQLPSYLKSLLGPSRTWKTFLKQQDAIQFVKSRAGGLMAFAFEHGTGQRSFLACHPIMLWFIEKQRCQSKRCTYEIIQETCRSKLYLDIEFEVEYNREYDGNRMVETVLKLLFHKLEECYGVTCSRENVLDLDSSTSHKFSRHIIFQINDAAFENNYAVGNFVKSACYEITDSVAHDSVMKQTCEKYGLSESLIREIIITDRKGSRKPFIDTGVYSKNRHFRLLGSTKLHKNSPLVISQSNTFVPKKNEEYAMFLASLITHFDDDVKRILNFGPTIGLLKKDVSLPTKVRSAHKPSLSLLERFIEGIIGPSGRIRRQVSAQHEIIFEISGYRYCGNIGREHRSNNIKLEVDLDHMVVSQTCYDPECRGYRSEPRPLPPEILFLPEDEPVLLEAIDNLVSDEDLLELIEQCDDSAFFEEFSCDTVTSDFCEEDDSILLSVSLDNSVLEESNIKFEEFTSLKGESEVNKEQFLSDFSDSDLIAVAESGDLHLFQMNEDSTF